MLEKLGTCAGRYILYARLSQEWPGTLALPSQNWVAFVISDSRNEPLLNPLIDHCLAAGTEYVCAAGLECEWVHNLFDWAIVAKELAKQDETGSMNDDFGPMTTWHKDFDEGFWFAAALAFPDYSVPDAVVCLDASHDGRKTRIAELIGLINSGWLPD